MKVAIDLTSIPSKLTGVGIYTENMLRNLGEVDSENQYYIFIKKENSGKFFLARSNFRFIIIPNYIKMIRLLWEQFVLPIYLLFFGVDLMHSPHYTMPLLAFWVKRIVTFPDMTFFLFPEKHEKYKVLFFRWMMKKSARLADKIISISYSTSNDLMKLFSIKPEKIATTHLAVSEDFRTLVDNADLKSILRDQKLPQKYILFVGTIEPRKNIKGLIQAYMGLSDNIKGEYKLVIAGKKGWYCDDLFKQVIKNGLENYIFFVGYVRDELLPLIYNGAAIFVYPSFYEGFGLPVLEALACGVPTITSNTSSMPEIAGNAARLIDPNNTMSIKAAIEELLTNDALRLEMKTNGIEQAKKFSWRKCAKETLDVYKEQYARA